ncbi:MAG: hypothetical protein H0V25_11430 [Solirubrobacterales bacterium]|nr:hypothetical protein [Solirubrobacterales bacterium]
MSRSTLEWFELLARSLIWAAGIILTLSLIGAVMIAGSDNALPFAEAAERQGKGIAALASLGAGLTAAGVLAGLGAILRTLLADRLERLEAEGPETDDDSGTGGRGPVTPDAN